MAPILCSLCYELGCLLIRAPGDLSPWQKEPGLMEKTACILGVPGCLKRMQAHGPAPLDSCAGRGPERDLPRRAPPWSSSRGM